ncbi:hypothetical protein GCM10025771_25010 [Niveibacterium umoris]|uniref:Glycosyltransferase involved in cell wall biosynthesis n=1 Tax=Niveibacterium umoris TaxID=1193620 RepID=A0A840BFK9_9RHOO|nr:glycosyltransferase family A protein [Niveibacterium umoris]MBB4012311.1 glycosyltransferase involved in cell wall biosynthesis [Niveibacterium umoris]
MPRVSIVVPAYNAGPFLEKTLKSVLASSYDDYEIVVVDDGSTDDTAAIAAAMGPKVRLIRQENQGMSKSRNNAVASGDSEFIALLDSDDIWHPDKLRLQVAMMDESPEVGLSYTEFTVWDGADATATFEPTVSSERDTALSGWIYPKMLLTNFVLPSSALFRRTLWNALGPFVCEDHQTDDWEYFVRASRQFPFAKLKSRLVLYRQHPTSLSRALPKVNKTEAMRERLIARFGLECENGGPADLAQLAARRQRGRCHFADAHVARGDLALGLREFSALLASGPNRLDSFLSLLKALASRVRRKLARA